MCVCLCEPLCRLVTLFVCNCLHMLCFQLFYALCMFSFPHVEMSEPIYMYASVCVCISMYMCIQYA